MAYRFAMDKTELLEQARDNLTKTAKRMKKYANQHRRDLEFKEWDKMMLKLTFQIWKKVTVKKYLLYLFKLSSHSGAWWQESSDHG